MELQMAAADLGALKGMLGRFEKALANTAQFQDFSDLHYTEITRLAFTLRSLKDPQIRSFYDRIFTNKLGLGRRVPKPVTRLFEQFIRGITYFQNQVSDEPYTVVYHRLEACGPGDDAYRRLHQQCTDDMPQQRRSEIRRKIETCYIERLIYDRIYKEITLHFPNIGSETHEQDQAHRDRLEIVKADFKSCFWNLDIDVDIKFDMHMPYELTITRTIRGQFASSETYTKTISFDPIFGGKCFDNDVTAIRKTNKYTYTRVQSFVTQPNWVRCAP